MATNPFELHTAPLYIHRKERDAHPSGLPSYLLEPRAEEVFHLLLVSNIDPNTAYFRGRRLGNVMQTEPPKVGSLLYMFDGSTDALDVYDGIYDEDAAKKVAREGTSGGRTDNPQPQAYRLGSTDTLFLDDAAINPIYAAGVTDQSFIDVYDKAKLEALSPAPIAEEETPTSVPDLIKTVSTSEEQLSLAAVACIRLVYEIHD